MEHNGRCICERCLLLDEIMLAAKELNECIVGKLYGEYVLPIYPKEKREQEKRIQRLREIQ
jgi:hypothetical protein